MKIRYIVYGTVYLNTSQAHCTIPSDENTNTRVVFIAMHLVRTDQPLSVSSGECWSMLPLKVQVNCSGHRRVWTICYANNNLIALLNRLRYTFLSAVLLGSIDVCTVTYMLQPTFLLEHTA